MTDAAARTIARIAGPSLIALAATEWLNMDIFAQQTAPVVYLNGTLLLVGGVAILQAHSRWNRGWPVMVTLTGWLILALEFQLAADILATTVAPSKEELIRLAIIAVIRTFLNYFLGKELDAQAERQQAPGAKQPEAPR